MPRTASSIFSILYPTLCSTMVTLSGQQHREPLVGDLVSSPESVVLGGENARDSVAVGNMRHSHTPPAECPIIPRESHVPLSVRSHTCGKFIPFPYGTDYQFLSCMSQTHEGYQIQRTVSSTMVILSG
jgi:hypothetical protein